MPRSLLVWRVRSIWRGPSGSTDLRGKRRAGKLRLRLALDFVLRCSLVSRELPNPDSRNVRTVRTF